MKHIIPTDTFIVMKSLIVYPALLMLMAACGGKTAETEKTVADNVIPVVVASIDTANGSNTIAASGLITAANEAKLSFKIGGVIDAVPVQEGQAVRKGQLLASLNSTEISAQVQQAQISLEKAQRDYQRASSLYKDSVVTLEQLQNSKTGMDIARQTLQQVTFNRQFANIYAPADGFIIKKISNAGEVTGPGSPVVIMGILGGNSKWILRAGVADREWAVIEPGNKATVTTDAFKGKTFNAVVSRKSSSADPASGSFEIELVIDMQELKPAAGMFGQATITPFNRIKALTIPYDALLEASGDKGYVFVTDDMKTVQRVEVTIASIEKDRVLIADGLNGHAYVVISGSPYLTNGSAISISQPSPTNDQP
jgi:RND family efflux transporter MFP subunit